MENLKFSECLSDDRIKVNPFPLCPMEKSLIWWTKCIAILALVALSMIGTAGQSEDVTVKENIVYGKGGEAQLKLDLARPSGDGPFPAIVFIHGGGFY